MQIMQIKMDDHGGLWYQPKQLRKKFNMSRSTLYRIIDKMRENPKYSEAVIDLSKTLSLVSLDAFMLYLKDNDKKYLTE